MPYGEDTGSEESVAWPGYVDFLSTFVFVLIIFIGSLLYLLSGDISRRIVEGFISPVEKALTGAGVPWLREGDKIKISLTGKVEFQTNQVKIGPAQERFLREVGPVFTAKGLQRIVVRGLADSQQCPSDPFCNWEISARRAQEVLKFFYNCTDCGYGDSADQVRRLLVVSGDGDTASTDRGRNNSQERRVDIILDFNAKKE